MNKISEFSDNISIDSAEPAFVFSRKNITQDKIDSTVDKLRHLMYNQGHTLDEALKKTGLTRTSAPVGVMRVMLRETLMNKTSLYKVLRAEEKAEYIRAADFEAFMEAAESKDRETQLAYSKVLRADSQLDMNAPAPSVIISIEDIADIITPATPAVTLDITPKNDTIERESN